MTKKKMDYKKYLKLDLGTTLRIMKDAPKRFYVHGNSTSIARWRLSHTMMENGLFYQAIRTCYGWRYDKVATFEAWRLKMI